MAYLNSSARKTRDAAIPGTIVHDCRGDWRIESWVSSRYATAVAVKNGQDGTRRTTLKLGEFDVGPRA